MVVQSYPSVRPQTRLNSNHLRKQQTRTFHQSVKGSGLNALVRVTGLEPVRRGHTPLKRACLPIPAHSHLSCQIIISNRSPLVNKNFNKIKFHLKKFLKSSIIILSSSKCVSPDGLAHLLFCFFGGIIYGTNRTIVIFRQGET